MLHCQIFRSTGDGQRDYISGSTFTCRQQQLHPSITSTQVRKKGSFAWNENSFHTMARRTNEYFVDTMRPLDESFVLIVNNTALLHCYERKLTSPLQIGDPPHFVGSSVCLGATVARRMIGYAPTSYRDGMIELELLANHNYSATAASVWTVLGWGQMLALRPYVDIRIISGERVDFPSKQSILSLI